ncbi:CLC_0170 family protein [Thermoanaerobacterium sp. RBIITD]|uniref:CLC_0170 family protein n=1 Tax=Thermoanaerobacterium sp. RBIITD TaxID=1550240 RepID=UPI000BB7BB68|nr:CLC_0170 family protein [Thermoanaerobacterium sp. RBIITD]SNX53944.1 hypothetical protein SAMN05660242_1564 [Thermoanaerobacterium sp. RBIITD]
MNFIILIKQVFKTYLFVTLLIVGVYESIFEPNFLDRKGLQQDSKICRIIGIAYLIIDALAYIFYRISPV